MKDYALVITYLAMIYGGIIGTIKWISLMAELFDAGEAFWGIIFFIFGQIIIPFNGIIPALLAFVVLFIVGLPIYGIYSLFKK